MGKNIDKRLWGVLGKQQTYFSPQKQVEGKGKVPLNHNAFDSWDVKRSRFRRVDGYENRIQQHGVVPQETSAPVVSPTPTLTPTNTPSPTPSFTPTMTQTNTPSITPSSTPYPLPIQPSLWFDGSDSSYMSLILSGGNQYVSTWTSKGTDGWVLSGTNTDTMPIMSASTLMPGNPNIVRFTPNGTATLRDGLTTFNNTPITHTGGTWFYVWAKPSGSTYATSLYTAAVYSGTTNGGTIPNSVSGFIDRQFINLTNVGGILNTYSIQNNQIIPFTLPVYSAAGLNDKYVVSCNFQDTTGEFNYLEINQSAQTNTTSFTGSSAVGTVNSFIMGITITTSAGTQSYNNSNLELAEVMWFNTDLSVLQREQVELYLKDKWRYDEWATPVPTPTQTASPTQTNTPSITPSQTPTLTNTPTPSTTPPPFSPSSLSPNIWVDFNDKNTITFRTGTLNIEKITNKGTDATLTAFTQSVAADQPLWGSGTSFTTSVSATSISNDVLKSNADFSSSTMNVFCVIAGLGAASLQSITPVYKYGPSNESQYFGLNRVAGAPYNFRHSIQGTYVDPSNNITQLYTGITFPTSAQTMQWFISTTGSSVLSFCRVNTSATTQVITSNNGTVQNKIGSGRVNLLNFDGVVGGYSGQIGEIFIFTRELTTTEENNLNTYLKTKWGLLY